MEQTALHGPGGSRCTVHERGAVYGLVLRAIILFGRNVASYKFALGGALLEVGGGQDLVTLEELAIPFACRVARHLKEHDKQGTFETSRFLDACRAFNRRELDEDGLRAKTVELGFANVIDAFHIVDQAALPQRFFIDERRTAKGIRLTDQLRGLVIGDQAGNLSTEIESRWQLVETAWELNLPRNVLTVDYEPRFETLVVPRRREPITGARGALNGYQKGHCFYCFTPITIVSGVKTVCEVDHVFAWSIGARVGRAPVDGVWNLVLACSECNGWHAKSNRPPHIRYVERLHRRNEFLISSHHPLRPTLMAQTGVTEADRAATLQGALMEASGQGVRASWEAPGEGAPAF